MKHHYRWREPYQRACPERSRRAFTLLELLVVIFLIAIISSILLPAIFRTRHHDSNRVKCASNLRQIGMAILLYSNENKGNYPRVNYLDGGPIHFGTGVTATDPFAGPNRPLDNDVTAALFLLIRTQDITPEVFICPSADGVEKDTYGTSSGSAANAVQSRSNFTDWRKNLSYSYANPYPDQAAVTAAYTQKGAGPTGQFAVAADLNPGVGDGHDVTAVTINSTAQDMTRLGNSRNHQGAGQNVLYDDGHVEFQPTIFAGVKRDNIFTVSRSTDGSDPGGSVVVGSPRWPGDSVLLPAFK